MESYIHKYLNTYYELKPSSEASKKLTLFVTYGIYHRDRTNRYGSEEIFSEDLLKELGTIFNVSEKEAKAYVNSWAKSINKLASLKAYWKKLASLLPIAMRVAARTISMELVSVQPMEYSPKGNLFYFDHPTNIEAPAGTPIRDEETYQEVVETVPSWKLEKIMKLMENQEIFVSSRKKE